MGSCCVHVCHQDGPKLRQPDPSGRSLAEKGCGGRSTTSVICHLAASVGACGVRGGEGGGGEPRLRLAGELDWWWTPSVPYGRTRVNQILSRRCVQLSARNTALHLCATILSISPPLSATQISLWRLPITTGLFVRSALRKVEGIFKTAWHPLLSPYISYPSPRFTIRQSQAPVLDKMSSKLAITHVEGGARAPRLCVEAH